VLKDRKFPIKVKLIEKSPKKIKFLKAEVKYERELRLKGAKYHGK